MSQPEIEPTIDDLARAYADEDHNLAELVELARCVSINLENIRYVAEKNPLVGIAWGQAKGLCLALERFAEDGGS